MNEPTDRPPRRPFSDLLSFALFAASIVMLSANWWQFRVAGFILRAAWRYGDLALAERYGLNAAAHESLPVARFSWMDVAASTFLLLLISRLNARPVALPSSAGWRWRGRGELFWGAKAL